MGKRVSLILTLMFMRFSGKFSDVSQVEEQATVRMFTQLAEGRFYGTVQEVKRWNQRHRDGASSSGSQVPAKKWARLPKRGHVFT